MQFIATTSFVGTNITARKGEMITLTDKQVIADLLAVGYIEEIRPTKPKRTPAKKKG